LWPAMLSIPCKYSQKISDREGKRVKIIHLFTFDMHGNNPTCLKQKRSVFKIFKKAWAPPNQLRDSIKPTQKLDRAQALPFFYS